MEINFEILNKWEGLFYDKHKQLPDFIEVITNEVTYPHWKRFEVIESDKMDYPILIMEGRLIQKSPIIRLVLKGTNLKQERIYDEDLEQGRINLKVTNQVQPDSILEMSHEDAKNFLHKNIENTIMVNSN